MDRKSLKGHSAEKEKHKRETAEAARQLGKTEADVIKTADKVGAIKSELSDVNERIRAARGRVLDSAGKAGDQDKTKVEEKEKAAGDQRHAVNAEERRTAAEREKADQVRPADSRIKSGAELSKILQDTGKSLSEIGSELKQAKEKAEAQRKKSGEAMNRAISRNRK